MKRSSVVNNFYGNVSNTQFQQGTKNSSQYFSNTDALDYEKVIEAIDSIKKYEMNYNEEFGDKAQDIRDKVNTIYELAKKREEPSKIKNLLVDLKNLTVGITGSLMANGIQTMIGGLLPK